MNNYIQKGDNITVVALAAVSAGAGVLMGIMFGVALNDAASGDALVLVTEGVFALTAKDTDTATVGAAAYWDDTAKQITTTATDNTKVGVFVEAKTSGQTTATVRLNGSF